MTEELDRLARLEFEWERKREREIIRALEVIRTLKRRQGNRKRFRRALIAAVADVFQFKKLRCGTCKKWRAPDEFPKDRTRPSGRRPVCNDCDKIARMRRYWRRPAHFRKIQRNYTARRRREKAQVAA